MTRSADFDEFVAARSTRLLRTAYLLTRDHALAEDLLQTALTKAWFAWSRIEGDPEPYVRKILVNTFASWWRRKWNGEQAYAEPPEPADAPERTTPPTAARPVGRDGPAAPPAARGDRAALRRGPQRGRDRRAARLSRPAPSRARPARRSRSCGSTPRSRPSDQHGGPLDEHARRPPHHPRPARRRASTTPSATSAPVAVRAADPRRTPPSRRRRRRGRGGRGVVAGVAAAATLRDARATSSRPVPRSASTCPQSVDVDGFPYELTEASATLGRRHRLARSTPADDDRAVSLVADRAGLRLRHARTSDGDADRPGSRRRAGSRPPYRLRRRRPRPAGLLDGSDAGARAGVAVYEATGELAPGVRRRDRRLPRRVAPATRCSAQPSPSPGDVERRGSRSPGSRATVRFAAYYCDRRRTDLMINVDIDGEPAASPSAAATDVPTRPPAPRAMLDGRWIPATHDVRVYLTREDDDETAAVPSVESASASTIRQSRASRARHRSDDRSSTPVAPGVLDERAPAAATAREPTSTPPTATACSGRHRAGLR